MRVRVQLCYYFRLDSFYQISARGSAREGIFIRRGVLWGSRVWTYREGGPRGAGGWFTCRICIQKLWIQKTILLYTQYLLKLLSGMQRSGSEGPARCEQHEFRLCPLNDSIYNGQYYNVSFCGCKQERQARRTPKPHRQTKNLTFPRFNRDNNFSTPAFILNSERNYYESEGVKMREEHERKMEDYTEEKVELNVPKPRSKNNYCSVCKATYEDYLDHINSDPHKRRIHQSAFNRDILELAAPYQRDHRKRRARATLEKNLSTRIEDSDEVEIISNPYKLSKPNENVEDRPQSIRNIVSGAFYEGAGSTFKPFSTTYQEQMNQYILNLNIYLNPYSVGPQMPVSPMEMALQAKQQQLNMLQYSLLSQTQQAQMQLFEMQMRQPPLSLPALGQRMPPPHGPPAQSSLPGRNFIVIDS